MQDDTSKVGMAQGGIGSNITNRSARLLNSITVGEVFRTCNILTMGEDTKSEKKLNTHDMSIDKLLQFSISNYGLLLYFSFL